MYLATIYLYNYIWIRAEATVLFKCKLKNNFKNFNRQVISTHSFGGRFLPSIMSILMRGIFCYTKSCGVFLRHCLVCWVVFGQIVKITFSFAQVENVIKLVTITTILLDKCFLFIKFQVGWYCCQRHICTKASTLHLSRFPLQHQSWK